MFAADSAGSLPGCAAMSRRGVLAGATAAALTPALARAEPLQVRPFATGLKFPEGPVTYSNGDVTVVEIARGSLTRITPDGRASVIADLGEGPNGCAIGPDGAAYVARNGGLLFREQNGIMGFTGVPDPFPGGSIQRVDLKTGAARTLYREVGGKTLRGPNDICFDAFGGLWFTDTGKNLPRSRDNGGLYWAKPDGSEIREMAYPLLSPNGLALAPDRRTLYVVLSPQRQIVAYEITGPGQLTMDNGRPKSRVVCSLGGVAIYDNIAIEAGGNLVVAAVIMGALLVISPQGEVIETVKMPEGTVTAPAFGGPDMKTLYVTLSTTGVLGAIAWPRPGLKAPYRI